MPENLILEMKNICKAFPGVEVFDQFGFDLKRGEIHCIVGENGAGKSTLIKMFSGAHTPDKGEIYLDGKLVRISNPRAAMEMGIQTIYQEHTLFPFLNVMLNLFAGNEILNGITINRREMVKKTQEILDYLHSNIDPLDIVGQLGSGAQKTVEIARGLVQKSRVMILDEPTASFSQTEIDHLLSILKKLAESGISIIYISHHLEEVFKIADRATVIRDGIKISTYESKEITEQKLINDMVGRDVSLFYERPKVPIGEVKFEVKNLYGNGVKGASFAVRTGELLGIAGMVGSGRTELAEILFGAKKVDSGEFFIDGKKINIKTPLSAITNKMCYITEDRQATGLFLQHSLDKNIPIARYSQIPMPFALPKEDIKISQKYIDALSIKTPSVSQKVMFLSGGNQQKVVLGKWFATNADIFIFDEPTRGIDVGSKEEIYKIIVDLLQNKKAVIMISSDMAELIALCDKLIVMREGNMVAEIKKDEISEENILTHSIGGSI
ncbi:MAG: sugar ABC transporter ATP-binding protein [Spirochaetales bacterium]|nr:MAG: sugar ABC transporter ATP-binding protein [Spirochaetales bacterium]